MKWIAALAAFLTALAAPARAGFDAGMSAYRRDDFATALREWRRAADKGDAIAQTCLGELYYEGLGVARDFDEAARWIRRAAEKNYAHAQSRMGDLYQFGLGVPRDFKQAAIWYGRAAEQAHADAEASLAGMYAEALGGPMDHGKARALRLRAAEHGHVGSLINLGRDAWNDRVQAFKWFEIAVALAVGEDSGDVVEYRDKMAARMSQTDIAEGQLLARKWLETHEEAIKARERTRVRCNRGSVKPRMFIRQPLKPGERARIWVTIDGDEPPKSVELLSPPPWQRK